MVVHDHVLDKGALAGERYEILLVGTNHTKLGDTGTPTGAWLGEIAEPYYVFKEAGFDVTFASPKGGEIPLDPGSQKEPFLTKEGEKFMADDAAMQQLRQSVPLEKVTEPQAYAAIFLPGGHGPMFDMWCNPKLAELLKAFNSSGKVVSAVCHGPAGLLAAPEVIKGRKVTGFSNTEEEAVGKTNAVPWLLEDKLKEAGGQYAKADDWQAFIQEDGNLITGQNPGSSIAVAEAVVKKLKGR